MAEPGGTKAFPVSWDQFHRDARALAWRLSGSGPFQAIVCITRGGLVPAAIVARELDIRLIETVCIASYHDYKSQGGLPYQEIDWSQPLFGVRGLTIGLQLDAGLGLPVDAEVRSAVEAAAKAFEAAGATVVPIPGFMTRAMAEGMNDFWRTRCWLDISTFSDERRAKVLPFIVEWARGAAGLSGERVFKGYSQMAAMRDAAVAACAPFDFVLSPTAPMTAFAAELPCPTNDPALPFEHIAFTLPYNMSEQPAASINCGYSAAGLLPPSTRPRAFPAAALSPRSRRRSSSRTGRRE